MESAAPYEVMLANVEWDRENFAVDNKGRLIRRKVMGAKSKNTTWAGVGAILAGLTLIVNMLNEGAFSFETVIAAVGMISAGVTGLFAKDSNVTGAGDGAEKV